MSEYIQFTITLDTPPEDTIAPPLGQFIDDHDDRIVGQIELAPIGSRTEVRFKLNGHPAEAIALSQYLRDLFYARDVPVLGTDLIPTIRYHGESPESFYRQMSKDLLRKHEPLESVNYVSHFPKFEIWLRYADGARVYSGRITGTYDIHFLALGYVGEGPRYAKSFLNEAGLSMSSEEIEAIKPGETIEISVADRAESGQYRAPSEQREQHKWWKFWK